MTVRQVGFADENSDEEASDDAVPLIVADKAASSAPSSSLFKLFFLPVLLVCAVVIFMVFAGEESQSIPLNDVASKAPGSHVAVPNTSGSQGEGGQVIQEQQQPNEISRPSEESSTGFEILLETMNQGFRSARQSLVEKLKADYGQDGFQALFLDGDGITSRGRTIVKSVDADELGWKRLKRKVTIKVLKALDIAQQRMRKRQLGEENENDDLSRMIPFIWATGGHSAAAAHGNLYNQSYTAFMEKGVKDLFAAVGMNFVGRNYAMGGRASAPEISFCIESIFGTDFDVLSWDFGMTDGRNDHFAELYFHRAGLSANNPAAILIGGGKERPDSLNKRGMTSLYEDDFRQGSQQLVPDSAGLTEEEIESMPPFVRNFRCGRLIENGDPHCGSQKFDDSICPVRMYETSWHPGWKAHALRGNFLALFLAEILGDSLADIQACPDPKQMLKELESQDQADHRLFLDSDLPPRHRKWTVPEAEDEEILRILYKQPNICHLAPLPSEIRYKGILTESAPVGMFDLPDGLLNTQVDRRPNDGDHFRLVGDAKERQQCPVPLNVDHQDFFYLSNAEGWKDLMVPNDAEIREYGKDEPLKGLLAICHAVCPWNKCPENNIIGGIEDQSLEMEVNGQSVKSMFLIKDGCFLLENSNGFFWKPSSSGQFTFRARVMEQRKYIRFTSFIIW